MPKYRNDQQISINGSAAYKTVELTADAAANVQVSVPAAQPATLTTRTDNDTGTLTMTNANHGITTGRKIDIYWSNLKRYDVTVGTVSGTSVPIDLGAGDNLPVVNTVVSIGLPESVNFGFVGDDMKALVLVANGGARTTFVIADATPAVHLAQEVAAGGTYVWDSDSGITNPIAGDTSATISISHADETAAATLTAAALFN